MRFVGVAGWQLQIARQGVSAQEAESKRDEAEFRAANSGLLSI